MPKKSTNKKYLAVLDKFGLVHDFDLTDKEKKAVKILRKQGDMDFLTLAGELDYKPEKARKVVNSLIEKGAVEQKDEILRLTPLYFQYFHAKKTEAKSAKKFLRFVDTLSDKEIDDFLSLVSAFKVVPEPFVDPEVAVIKIEEILSSAEAPKEEKKEEPKPEEPKVEEPKVEEPKVEEPKVEEIKPAPAKKPAPRKRAPAKKPAAKPVSKPVSPKEGE